MSRYAYMMFAQAYGQGGYNNCDYNCATTAATGSNTGSGSGQLADTGIALVAVATIACLIIFIALLVRAAGRRRHQGPHSGNAPSKKSSNRDHIGE